MLTLTGAKPPGLDRDVLRGRKRRARGGERECRWYESDEASHVSGTPLLDRKTASLPWIVACDPKNLRLFTEDLPRAYLCPMQSAERRRCVEMKEWSTQPRLPALRPAAEAATMPRVSERVSDGDLIQRVGIGDRNAFEALYRRFARAGLRPGPAPARRPRARRGRAPGDVHVGLALGVDLPARARPGRAVAVRGRAQRDRRPRPRARRDPRRAARGARPSSPARRSRPRPRGSPGGCTCALQELPERERTVLELAYWSGLSQSEVATFLNIPLGTVKTRTRSALARLADMLEERSCSEARATRSARARGRRRPGRRARAPRARARAARSRRASARALQRAGRAARRAGRHGRAPAEAPLAPAGGARRCACAGRLRRRLARGLGPATPAATRSRRSTSTSRCRARRRRRTPWPRSRSASATRAATGRWR